MLRMIFYTYTHFFTLVSLFYLFSFIIFLLPASNANLYFDMAPVSVQRQRDYCQSLLLAFPAQMIDFFGFKQECAAAFRIIIFQIGRWFVARDVQIDEACTLVVESDKGAGELDATAANRFHLWPGQYQTCLVGVENIIVKTGAFIRGIGWHMMIFLSYFTAISKLRILYFSV